MSVSFQLVASFFLVFGRSNVNPCSDIEYVRKKQY